jgi:hypothetical protein
MHRITKRFWEYYGSLTKQVRGLADKNFQLLKRIDKVWSLLNPAVMRTRAVDYLGER